MQFIISIAGTNRAHRRVDLSIVVRGKWFLSSDFDLYDPEEQLTHMDVFLVGIIFISKTAKWIDPVEWKLVSLAVDHVRYDKVKAVHKCSPFDALLLDGIVLRLQKDNIRSVPTTASKF